MSGKLNLNVEAGSKLLEEFQLVDAVGDPLDLTGKTVRFVCKESLTTDIELFNIELNVDYPLLGMFTLSICADDTLNKPTEALYEIYLETSECDVEEVLEGTIKFNRGLR